MNAHKSKDQQAIAKLVRAFVSPSTPPESLVEVAGALKAAIRSPSDIIRCETIPESHFLKREALAARDAFEAATNGMSAPEAFQALEELDPASVFAPWKELVAAVRAFYEGDAAGLGAALARIEAGSFPGRAAGLWSAIASRAGKPAPAPEGGSGLDDFLSGLFPESDALSLRAEGLLEALEEGMHELFISICARFFRELAGLSLPAAEKAALLVLARLDGRGDSPDDFLAILKSCLGEARSLRLTALYLSDSRPALALLFWVRAACRSLEEEPGPEALRAWSLLLERAALRAAVREGSKGGRPGEYRAALEPLVEAFERTARGILPSLDPVLAAGARERLAALAAATLGAAGEAPGSIAARKTKPRDQLELFA